MIKNIFLPEQIRGYYPLPVTIIGFDIGKTSVKAAVIHCKGTEITIEKFFEEPITIGIFCRLSRAGRCRNKNYFRASECVTIKLFHRFPVAKQYLKSSSFPFRELIPFEK